MQTVLLLTLSKCYFSSSVMPVAKGNTDVKDSCCT